VRILYCSSDENVIACLVFGMSTFNTCPWIINLGSKSGRAYNIILGSFTYKMIHIYKGILECDALPEEKYRTAHAKIKYIEHLLSTAENALGLLDDTEKKVITDIYFRKEELYDVCEECSLERSSIYRYRTSALKKIAKAVYGIDENEAV